VREDEAARKATTELPLQAQLMGSLALILILSGIAGIIGYTTCDARVLQSSVEAKAGVYATNLAAQLYNPIAAGSPALSEAVIKPLQSDRNVFGIGVYSVDGRLLAGHGQVPARLESAGDARLMDDRTHMVVREVPIEQGASGLLLRRNRRDRRNARR
jgi:uncharacterized membrane protein affecting hemolysin expression